MPRTKKKFCYPRSIKNAETAKMSRMTQSKIRSNETQEQSQARQAKISARSIAKPVRETEAKEQKQARVAENASRRLTKRSRDTVAEEQKKGRITEDAAPKAAKRAKETKAEEQKQGRNAENAAPNSAQPANETEVEEQLQTKLAERKSATEIEALRKKRLSESAALMAARRDNETEAERKKRLTESAARSAARRARETEAERERRLLKDAARSAAKRREEKERATRFADNPALELEESKRREEKEEERKARRLALYAALELKAAEKERTIKLAQVAWREREAAKRRQEEKDNEEIARRLAKNAALVLEAEEAKRRKEEKAQRVAENAALDASRAAYLASSTRPWHRLYSARCDTRSMNNHLNISARKPVDPESIKGGRKSVLVSGSDSQPKPATRSFYYVKVRLGEKGSKPDNLRPIVTVPSSKFGEPGGTDQHQCPPHTVLGHFVKVEPSLPPDHWDANLHEDVEPIPVSEFEIGQKLYLEHSYQGMTSSLSDPLLLDPVTSPSRPLEGQELEPDLLVTCLSPFGQPTPEEEETIDIKYEYL